MSSIHHSDSILKVMIVLSDGIASDKSLHSSIITEANDKDVKIYTVGLGSSTSYFNNYLKPLAENTSGVFYLASDAGQLTEIYENISAKIDFETDSDNDGISDYYEENIPMFNGFTVKLDKNNPDSDDDGLEDGEEVKLIYEYNEDKTQVKVTGKFLSNPNAEDTDKDGLTDWDELYCYDTYALFADSDRDGLNDGTEIENWFAPRSKDYDKDGRPDLEEYEEGTSPYVYNVDFGEFICDFGWGVFLGDIIHDTDSIPCMLGQIAGSCIPLVDIRDFLANCYYKDYSQAEFHLICLAKMKIIIILTIINR